MRIVRLMSSAPVRKRKSVYKKVLTESQWKARYRLLVWWYFRKAEKRRILDYQKFARFTVL
jgi:hypothetical protein